MQFKDIIGHEDEKKRLITTVKENRISHAQLFLGQEGCGKLALAIAYAQYINCTNKTDEDSCGVCPQCVKYQKVLHPDLHFVYPVVKQKKSSKMPVSDDYIKQWREFIQQRNYHRIDDWYDYIGSDNAQGAIFAQESAEIIRKLNLKTFEAEYKVMIIWMPEKMNETAANKLLKMIEEPPAKTLFILVSENEEEILTTIRSRTQLVKITKPTNNDISQELAKEFPEADEQTIKSSAIIGAGNYLEAVAALKQFTTGNVETPDFNAFAQMMRNAYANKYDLMIKWAEEQAKNGREKQKKFFDYCLRMLRECFMLNTLPQTAEQLVNLTPGEMEFAKKFARFIHTGNVEQFSKIFTQTSYGIERNGNAKILFTDLALSTAAALRLKP